MEFNIASAAIGNLSVSLTLNTAAFQKGAAVAEKRAQSMQSRLQGIGNSLKGVGAGLAAGLGAGAVAGLAAVTKNAFEMGSSLTEAASKVGVTVEALQEMRYVAEQNGTSIDTIEGSLNKMTKTLGALQMGNKGAAETFKALGLSAQQMIGLTPTESFTKIAGALANIEDETVRAALGNQVFGRSYAELKPIIALGADGIRRAAEEKRKDGVLSTEQAAKLDDLADGWDKLTGKLGVASAQFIANRAGSVNASAGLDKFGDSVQNLMKDITGLMGTFDRLNLAMLKVSRFSAKMGRDGVGGALFKSVRDANQSEMNRIDAEIQKLESAPSTGRVRGTGRRPQASGSAGGALGASMAGAGAGALATLEKLEEKAARVGTTVAEPISRMATQITASFRGLSDRVQPIMDRLFPDVKALVDYKADQNDLKAWFDAGKISLDTFNQSLVRLRDNYFGADGPMAVTQEDGGFIENITDSLPDLAEIANNTTLQVTKSTEEMAEAFAVNTQSILGSLSNLANSIKGGGFLGILQGIAGVLGSLSGAGVFGGGKFAAFASSIGSLFGGPGRARGGAMTSNRSYLVGERGPEIMTMGGRPGFMTPNNKLGDASGRGSRELTVVPSKFFELVVREQAASVAAPMAGRAAMAGAQIAQSNIQSRQRRRLP